MRFRVSNGRRGASGPSQKVVKAKHRENRDSLGGLLIPIKLILQNRSGIQGPLANRGFFRCEHRLIVVGVEIAPITIPLIVGIVVRITSWTFSHCVCGPLSKVSFQSISLYLQNRLILRRFGITLIELNVLCTQ